jgi:hypothetical protein
MLVHKNRLESWEVNNGHSKRSPSYRGPPHPTQGPTNRDTTGSAWTTYLLLPTWKMQTKLPWQGRWTLVTLLWTLLQWLHQYITTLVDKAKFLAPKQLEREYPETPHPNPSLLHPHPIYYGTDIGDGNDPEIKKYNNWHCTKNHRVTEIELNIATDPTKTSNKEDLATVDQFRTQHSLPPHHHYKKTSPKPTPQTMKMTPPNEEPNCTSTPNHNNKLHWGAGH